MCFNFLVRKTYGDVAVDTAHVNKKMIYLVQLLISSFCGLQYQIGLELVLRSITDLVGITYMHIISLQVYRYVVINNYMYLLSKNKVLMEISSCDFTYIYGLSNRLISCFIIPLFTLVSQAYNQHMDTMRE